MLRKLMPIKPRPSDDGDGPIYQPGIGWWEKSKKEPKKPSGQG